MKRSAPKSSTPPKAKRRTLAELPDYHLSAIKRDANGDAVWPAPKEQLEGARRFITECAQSNRKTLLVPDKDADGLAAGVIMYRTLVLLGLAPENIAVHLLRKGNSVHSEEERRLMTSHSPSYIIVLDQGSRKSPPLIEQAHNSLVIDHHFVETYSDFPARAQVVSACHCPPVATSSLLTYLLCIELHPEVQSQCDWLCALGTHGDLGNTLKWADPFPDMRDMFKKYTKKAVNDAVSLINAPRRTAGYKVQVAWEALLDAANPAALLKYPALLAARAEVAEEVERCTHTAPKFSADTKFAVFRISSQAQVHPIIATRWANHLSSSKLEIVLVANTGYLPGQVNFSCRIVRSARARDPPVDIISSLKAVAASSPTGTLVDRLGQSFARGHAQASGGIVGLEEFEELMQCLRVGEKADGQVARKQTTAKTTKDKGMQKNTLMNYFGKPSS